MKEKVFSFSELPKKSQQVAIEKIRNQGFYEHFVFAKAQSEKDLDYLVSDEGISMYLQERGFKFCKDGTFPSIFT